MVFIVWSSICFGCVEIHHPQLALHLWMEINLEGAGNEEHLWVWITLASAFALVRIEWDMACGGSCASILPPTPLFITFNFIIERDNKNVTVVSAVGPWVTGRFARLSGRPSAAQVPAWVNEMPSSGRTGDSQVIANNRASGRSVLQLSS